MTLAGSFSAFFSASRSIDPRQTVTRPFAALTNGRGKVTVAQQVSINYLSAAKGTKLTATARYRKDGRSSCVVNVDVVDDTGREIAQFVGTGFKLNG